MEVQRGNVTFHWIINWSNKYSPSLTIEEDSNQFYNDSRIHSPILFFYRDKRPGYRERVSINPATMQIEVRENSEAHFYDDWEFKELYEILRVTWDPTLHIYWERFVNVMPGGTFIQPTYYEPRPSYASYPLVHQIKGRGQPLLHAFD